MKDSFGLGLQGGGDGGEGQRKKGGREEES